jgi:hypothetical protein
LSGNGGCTERLEATDLDGDPGISGQVTANGVLISSP